MSEYAVPVDSIDNRYFRRAGYTAVVYALVDVLNLFYGGPFVLFRLVGVIAGYFVIKDMVVLYEAGVDWGWTRYLVLMFVAVGGFLGFIVYAWRRYIHLEAHSVAEATPETAAGPDDGSSGTAGDEETADTTAGTDSNAG